MPSGVLGLGKISSCNLPAGCKLAQIVWPYLSNHLSQFPSSHLSGILLISTYPASLIQSGSMSTEAQLITWSPPCSLSSLWDALELCQPTRQSSSLSSLRDPLHPPSVSSAPSTLCPAENPEAKKYSLAAGRQLEVGQREQEKKIVSINYLPHAGLMQPLQLSSFTSQLRKQP